MPLKELLDEFLGDLEIQNYSKRTLKSYRNTIGQLLRYLEEKYDLTLIDNVKALHIKSFIKSLTGRKATYVNSLIKRYKVFFKYCYMEEYIESNPMDKITLLKAPKPMINTFNDDEIKRILSIYNNTNFLESRNKSILMTFIDSGCRCSELINLTLDDIKDGVITIRESKGLKTRYIPLSITLKKQLNKYCKRRETYARNRDTPNNLFLSVNGKKLTVEAVERIVRKACIEANVRSSIRGSCHDFRHWYAQYQIRNGLDLHSLSVIMGHSSVAITQIYLNSLEVDKVLDMANSPLNNLK